MTVTLRRIITLVGVLLAASCVCLADVTFVLPLTPGSENEAAALLANAGSTLDHDARCANVGQDFTYAVALPAKSRCVLSFTMEGDATIQVYDAGGKPLPSRIEQANGIIAIYATAPTKNPIGGRLRFTIRPSLNSIKIRYVKATIVMHDSNGDGLPDSVTALMGVPPGKRAIIIPKPDKPKTSFQSAAGYTPDVAVPTDGVLVYSPAQQTMASWAERGQVLMTMGGFRDGPEYAKAHPEEVQTDRDGKPITIAETGYYMLPTQSRLEIARKYYETAIGNGSRAICPEEPEIFAKAGYSEGFKQEWLAHYGTPWEPPHESVDARWKSEQLKAFLVKRQIETISNYAEQLRSTVTRMVAVHSPVTYSQWGITLPHFALLTIPALQEIIGQVWTGTARSPARLAGVRTERTFEVGYLEYSSLYNLTRGTNKRLWFLMDPLEDNPDRTMEDYQSNYAQTLVASLMFPEIDSFEVMPWPQRIYGRVPAAYATMVNSIVGALCDMWRFPGGDIEAGSTGVGVFYADSMAWQRAEPAPSNFEGFYALCLPMVSHGVPVQVLSLDRVSEPGYLDRCKTLLVSYDFLKPSGPEINKALADWVKRGGCILLFGGTDAYNDVQDSWWRKVGVPTPVDDLFAQLSITTRRIPQNASAVAPVNPVVLLKSDGVEHNLGNRKLYSVDLSPYVSENGSVSVRFEDVTPQDGWGPFVVSAELKIGGKLALSFRAGSAMETRFLNEDQESSFSGNARFADGSGYWVYRFDNMPKDIPITLTLDMGNGFLVKAYPSPPQGPLLETTDPAFDPTIQKLRVPNNCTVTQYAMPGGASALYSMNGNAIVWQLKSGDGSVIYCGVPAEFASGTAQTDRWLRALVKRGMSLAGASYREQDHFAVKRGPFLAVRTLGKSYTLDGRFVNLLSPTLSMANDPEIPARNWAFLMNAGSDKGDPRLLAVSGRLRAKYETPATTSLIAQAPAKTDGVARFFVGKRRLKSLNALTVYGVSLKTEVFQDSDTLLVRYPNDPDGVILKALWN